MGIGHYWLYIDLLLAALVIAVIVWLVRTFSRNR